MARDRQRAKQRRAERRETRLAERGRSGNGDDATDGRNGGQSPSGGDAPSEAADMIAAGAPPETVGRSDTVVSPSSTVPPLHDPDAGAPAVTASTAASSAPPSERDGSLKAPPEDREGGPAGARAAEGGTRRGRIIAFLIACWAELQRVQWPTRTQLTSMTGIVLGFVVLAGGYLGLLDAIFSRLVRLIL